MSVLIIALLESPESAASLISCLELAGFEVDVVDSFEKAKLLLQDKAFDIIISDVHLQNGGSVFDFLKWVKSRSALKNIPFVLLSISPSVLAKYLADGVRSAARTLGAAKYISMEILDPILLISEIVDLLPSRTAEQLVLQEGK